MLIGLGVVVGAHWFVEMRRAAYKPPQPSMPITVADTSRTEPINSPSLNLITMSHEELVKLLPSYALVRLKSESGEAQPDDLHAIVEGGDQFLVMLGSRPAREGKKERLLSVFKLEEGQLADVSKETVPADFPGGKIGNELSQIRFADNGRDILVETPVGLNSSGIISECPVCEHASTTQEITWKDAVYHAGAVAWHNDPYTVCYIVAQALDKKKVDAKDRDLIDPSLDTDIGFGLDRRPKQLWSLEKVNSADADEKSPSVSYHLTNGFEGLTITVSNRDGRWLATGLKNE